MHVHFDCFSGISGDMVLGAFVDLGVPCAWLAEQVGGLGIGRVAITARDVKRNGIGAKQIDIVDQTTPAARDYRDIVALIEKAPFKERVKSIALTIFGKIAAAEARVHRCDMDAVHFHEVGAVDSIVDIVGTALCIDYCQIETATSSPLPLGGGFVTCSHGRLPVPAPATVEIVKGIPVVGGTPDGEWVTPTGAAIVASLATAFGPVPDMTITHVGYGSGTRETRERPNLLRIMTGVRTAPASEQADETIVLVETNIDDMNPEIYGYLMDRLFQEGAVDVCFVPVTMKKNRPGTKVEVLCPPERRPDVARCLFTETTTIGLRYQRLQRHTLRRSVSTVKTAFGEVQVKWTTEPGGRTRCAPEFDACRKIALENKVPLTRVYEAVQFAAAGNGTPGAQGEGGKTAT